MHVRTVVSLSVSLLAWTVSTIAASAEEGDSGSVKRNEKRVFVGLSAGAAYALVNHPKIRSDGFAAASLGMHVGYNVSERWSIGLEWSTVEHGMTRQNGYDPFTPTSFLRPQVKCDNCPDTLPSGGYVTQTTASFGTIGPRVEVSPLGRDGLYLGLSTGLGLLLGVDTQYGFGGGARAGYRYRLANVLGIALEGGVQAQYFSTGTTLFPYASLMMRPYF